MSTSDATLRMVLIGEDRSASKALGSVGDKAQKTSGHLHNLGKTAAGVFAGGALFEGAAKGVDFLKDSVKAAMADEQANAVLGRQLKNTTGASKEQIDATEEWIKKQSEATGVARDQLIPAFTQFTTTTGSVTKSQKLMSLAQNVSAGTGKSLSTITGALVRGYNGSVGGLSRLGIATKNADGSTKSFKQVSKELADHFKGDAATSADTAAGRMKRLGVTWEEMKVSLGEHLLPVLTKFLGFVLDKVIPAVAAFAGVIEDKVIPFIKNLADSFHTNTGSMSATAKQDLGAIEDTFKSVVSIVRSLWKRFGAFIMEYLGSTLKNTVQILSGVFKVIQGIFKVFSSLLRGDWKGVWTGIKEILSGALTIIKGLLKQALATIKLIWKAAWSVLKSLLSNVWDGIKALVRLEMSNVVDQIRSLPGLILKLDVLFLRAGEGLIKALFNGIVAAAKKGAGFVSSLIGSIKSAINSSLHLPLMVNFDKGPIHIHATVIPALAKGGIVTRPTMALIGEAGPEAVVPLSGPNARGFGGGDTYVMVTANGLVDPQSMARKIQAELNKLGRTTRGTLVTT